MPANKPGTQYIKHYGFSSDAAGTAAAIPTASQRVAPNTPDRTFLQVQNTGGNPGVLRFGEPCKGDGTDLTLGSGVTFVYDQGDTCPVEALNLASILGTTWAIVEGTTK